MVVVWVIIMSDIKRLPIEAEHEGTDILRTPYAPPKLKEFGSVGTLTQGGTGNAMEGSQGQRPRP